MTKFFYSYLNTKFYKHSNIYQSLISTVANW